MMSCLQGKEGALFIEIDFTWTLQTPLIQVLYSVYLRTVDRATIKIWILLAKCHSKSESNFPFRNSLKIFGCATNPDMHLLATIQYLCSLKCPHKIHFNTQCSRGGGAQCALLTRELISGYPMIYGALMNMSQKLLL